MALSPEFEQNEKWILFQELLREYSKLPSITLEPQLSLIERALPAISLLAETIRDGEAAQALPIVLVKKEALIRVLREKRATLMNEPLYTNDLDLELL